MAEASLIIKAERRPPCANGRPLQKEKAQPKEKEKVVKPNYKRIAGAPAPRRQKRETDRNGFVFHFSRYAHFHQKRAIIIRCSKILFLSLGRRWHTHLSKGFDNYLYHKKNKIKSDIELININD